MDDLASGATDWRAWDVAKEHGVLLHAHPDLHVKMYVADNTALVGSANATAAGLGTGPRPNLEMLVSMDAHHPDVADTLDRVRRDSSVARPWGSDMTGGTDGGEFDGALPLWLPDGDPGEFHEAYAGRTHHTEETRATCKSLGLDESGSPVSALRSALGDTTVFRVVRHAFDGRPLPMTLNDIRSLLADEIDPRLIGLEDGRMVSLVKWLGHFGENTHLGPHARDVAPSLYPGKRLATFRIGRKV